VTWRPGDPLPGIGFTLPRPMVEVLNQPGGGVDAARWPEPLAHNDLDRQEAEQ
jgi:hypothetical protein